jgi:hypothetical protein
MKRILLAGVWTYAALVTGSMAHVLFGIPDFGLILAATVLAACLLPPMLNLRRTG